MKKNYIDYSIMVKGKDSKASAYVLILPNSAISLYKHGQINFQTSVSSSIK